MRPYPALAAQYDQLDRWVDDLSLNLASTANLLHELRQTERLPDDTLVVALRQWLEDDTDLLVSLNQQRTDLLLKWLAVSWDELSYRYAS